MSTTTETSMDPRTDRTRQALMASSIRLTGQHGFDNTTVRQIADHAGANVAAITYHFGGKDGLRRATIEQVAARMRRAGPGYVLANLTSETISQMSAAEARALMRKVMATPLQSNVVERELAEVRAFIQREMFQGGESSRLFYDLVLSDLLDTMSLLVSRILETDPTDKRTRVRALMLLAQSVFFRMARPLVLLSMDWSDYGEDERAIVTDSFWLGADPDSSG